MYFYLTALRLSTVMVDLQFAITPAAKTGEHDRGMRGASQSHKGLITHLQPSHTHTHTPRHGNPTEGEACAHCWEGDGGLTSPPALWEVTIAALKTPTSLRDTKGEGERTEKGTKRKQKKGDCRLQMDTHSPPCHAEHSSHKESKVWCQPNFTLYSLMKRGKQNNRFQKKGELQQFRIGKSFNVC